MRRRAALLALGVGAGAALVVSRESIRDVWSNIRRYSAPGAGCYECLAGVLLGSFYDRVARDVVDVCRSGTILEVGPGPGHLAEAIARRAADVRIVGVDLDPDMVARAADRVRRAALDDRVSFIVGDVVALPATDGSVDLVVSTFSFHHWAERAAGLTEIGRVLRPGGRALLFDLHPAWVRFETGGEDAESVARASWPGNAGTSRLGWPIGLPMVVRVELEKG
jgi:ubiquinone/menaquinone biosynthesis C-methylase UbiE